MHCKLSFGPRRAPPLQLPFPLSRLVAGCWLALALALALFPAQAAGAERRVLVLYSLGPDAMSNWQRLLHDGMVDELARRGTAAMPVIHEERLDANRVGAVAATAGMAPHLRSKYARVRFDVVVAEGQVAALFLGAHPELFPGAARFYVNYGHTGWQPADGTPVAVHPDFDRAVGIVTRTAPQVRRLVVVGDSSARVQRWIAAIRGAAARHRGRLAFEYWTDKDFDQVARKLATLDRDSALLLLAAGLNDKGGKLDPHELAHRIAAASPVPVYTHLDSLVLPGMVGGYVVSGEGIGRVIGRILLGGRTDDIPLQRYVFDAPTVERYGLRDLPPDAKLLNRPDSVWERYRWQIVSGLTLIVLQGVLISALVVALRERRRTLAALNDERDHLEERVQRRTLELRTANSMLEQLATTDPLTGIANRRKMTEQIEAELERGRRFGHPVSVLMVDIDFFKRINDTFGHDTGDRAIVAVATLLDAALRTIDTAARFGGEEFVVLMPETEEAVAAVAAERLRAAVAALRIDADDGGEVTLTISIGVASAVTGDTPSTLLMRADQALYRAKQEGRDRVVRF
ncbi:diguanylate cyclase [Pseudoduganella sp. SL102]|uniref:sensor domain-containing diguanylate cyclase n=1 Tax=Pseudoduganella sp. SL102 TaxID=2995154 RepID=UPI00248D1016|nr:sensor domain-containing diguanylate cyclase [Pseudoduganella sp. SL102]WBS01423.1 diguanylate cyclase [Pseudoduganella sp. SL102]